MIIKNDWLLTAGGAVDETTKQSCKCTDVADNGIQRVCYRSARSERGWGYWILTSGVNPDDEYEDERVMIHLR